MLEYLVIAVCIVYLADKLLGVGKETGNRIQSFRTRVATFIAPEEEK